MNTLPEHTYFNSPSGLKSWLLTKDHKRIGLMYLMAISLFFLVGGALALVMRMELFAPGSQLMSADTYNRMFTLHGAIMIFLFIIPSIPAALGNFVLPMQLGAIDVAFPRLNLASWYIYVIGAVMALGAIVAGGIDTGWTFYTPYSVQTDGAVVLMVMAAFVLGFSSIFTGLNFIATVHKMRAPGMTWFKMPLYAWGIYATAIIQVLATPVLAITLLLLAVERGFGIGIFDPKMGGDPVLFQHFFWFYSHPAVYIMILPGMAIISEIMATFSRKRVFGYRAVAYSSLAIALLSFIVWGHHMFTSGQSELSAMIFSFLTFSVAIPSAVKVFNWMSTMYRGSISFDTPMLYALAFLFLFTIGGLTGLFLGTLAVDLHLHDTYFIVAHFHYTMMGGTVIAFLGGLHYWWPKIWGRMYSEKWARIAWALIFIGFNATFIPQFIMGSQGMPRRYFNYIEQYQPMHAFSSIGSYILGLGFLIMMVYLWRSVKNGPIAGSNPWGASTFEWTHATSPPDPHNFAQQPVCEHDVYPYDKVIFKSTNPYDTEEVNS
jgi:cytochrome c oxidase subunit I